LILVLATPKFEWNNQKRLKDNLSIMEENLDNQQKQEPQNSQNQGQSQTPSQPPVAQQKKPYRRYYGNRKKFRAPGEQSQSPSAIQKITFKKISIVVPLLNEDESLRPLFNEIKKVVRGISSDYELLFID